MGAAHTGFTCLRDVEVNVAGASQSRATSFRCSPCALDGECQACQPLELTCEALDGDFLRVREVLSRSSEASIFPIVCRMRIIAISDVYLLDNLPSFKSLVAAESEGFPAGNVVTALPGDFLAPSLLSSLDAGYSMVKVLNLVPIDYVCFGNHDGNDIAYNKLVHRVEEFNGTWLNSNMPDFEPSLPSHSLRSLTGEDGTPGVRTVGFLGFCTSGRHQAMYREEAFGGAHKTMTPVLDAYPGALEALRKEHPEVCEVIPFTHQDLTDDQKMAESGSFPMIVGGHDHEITLETHRTSGCKIVKPGMDATHAAIIDLEWASLDPQAEPCIKVEFKPVAHYSMNPMLAEVIDRAQRPIRELESATLYEVPRGMTISSKNVRLQPVTMATMIASSVRDCLGCDAAVINAGTVRGNQDYTSSISYGDLKKECPFQSTMVCVSMPASVLREAISVSRRTWIEALQGKPPKVCASALQVDDGIYTEDHVLTMIKGVQPQDDALYTVACDTYVLKGNKVFKEYCAQHPERIPPADCGRPLLPILVEYFCDALWRQLIDQASCQVMSQTTMKAFRDSLGSNQTRGTESLQLDEGCHRIFVLLDCDGDGTISSSELQRRVSSLLGEQLSSTVVIEQLFQMVDVDGDGQLTEKELQTAIRKVAVRD